MLYIQELWQKIVSTHENIRGKIPGKARWGIIALLAVLSFIIFIFSAEWLMTHMVAMLPLFYVTAVLAVGFKRALYGTAIFLFSCFMLWLRTGPPYDGVLGGSYVMFAENDGWYHARLIENLVAHFPRQITFDPYTFYPYGQELYFAPFFDWFIALFIWIAGLGHPSVELVEKMAAYFPAVLGTLTIIPVYFIGRELINRNFGLLCAGLIAIAPGEFLFRSILGFTDHHVIEVLLSTTTILFFILTIKRAREARPTFSQIRNREWAALKKPLLFSLLTGLVLGFYLLSWVGGLLFALIIFIYLVVQYIVDHLRGESTDYLCIIGTPIFLLSFIIFSPFWEGVFTSKYAMVALPFATIAPIVLSITSRVMERYSLRRLYYPLAILVLALTLAGIFYLISPSVFKSMLNTFINVFSPSTTRQTIMEAQPLLSGFHISQLFDHRIWSYFTTGMFMAPIAFLLLIYTAFRKNRTCQYIISGLAGLLLLVIIIDQFSFLPSQLYLSILLVTIAIYSYLEKDHTRILFVIWSAMILLELLVQTRFAYYFAVNVALLSGYLLWRLPGWITRLLALLNWKETPEADEAKSRAEKKRAKTKKEQQTAVYLRPKYVSAALSIIAVFFLAIYPNLIYGTYDDSGWSPGKSATLYLPHHPYGANADWHEALTWMKNNTPEPFEEPDFYYAYYEKPESGETYDYPDSAYGVMSWWDYGHWITRIAQRIPVANPHQKGIGGPYRGNTSGASTFMTAQDEATANSIMDELDSRYIVIDIETAYGKYHTMVTWSGGNISDYYDILYREPDGEVRTFSDPGSRSAQYQLFHPAYYQSMCARLYNFGTEAAVPNNSTWVILYAEGTDDNGEKYKYLADVANGGKAFASYEEAQEFLNNHPGYIIVGMNPFASPIPIEALAEYELIHSSPVPNSTGQDYPYVKVFEYTGYEK